jgi:hypothetical protein
MAPPSGVAVVNPGGIKPPLQIAYVTCFFGTPANRVGDESPQVDVTPD